MRSRKIRHVDEIANTGAVGCGVVCAENLEFRSLPECCLGGELDERAGFELSRPQRRIGAGDVEVAQDAEPQAVC
jgi:hypothetical protein